MRDAAYRPPPSSDFGANIRVGELRLERTEAARVAPFPNSSGRTLHCSRGESTHIVVLIEASIATLTAEENPLRKGPGRATLGRDSRHVTTVTEADVLIPFADTVNTKTCVPGSMTPPGKVIWDSDDDIIADAIKGAAKQGAGEQVQANMRSDV